MKPRPTIMPFGKFRGAAWGDIPTHYLEWCVENLNSEKYPELVTEIANQLVMRRGEGVSRGKAK